MPSISRRRLFETCLGALAGVMLAPALSWAAPTPRPRDDLGRFVEQVLGLDPDEWQVRLARALKAPGKTANVRTHLEFVAAWIA